MVKKGQAGKDTPAKGHVTEVKTWYKTSALGKNCKHDIKSTRVVPRMRAHYGLATRFEHICLPLTANGL